LRVKEPKSFFSRANTFGSRFPGDNVRVIRRDNMSVANGSCSLLIKNLRDEITVPIVGIRISQVRNVMRHNWNSNREIDVAVNFIPDRTPRSGPDARMTIVNLDNAILDEDIFDLEDG
jgi:hypothetical protein